MAADNAGHLTLDVEESPSAGTRIQPISPTLKSYHWTADQKKQTPLTLSERLGLKELLSLNVWRASVGELLGSAVLVFMIDTIVISTYETEIKMPNLIMSIFIAITLTILIIALFPVSGGHINPVISFSAALVGLISFSRSIVYIVAQCAGAVLGALALKAVISSNIEQNFSLGGCTLTVIAPGPQGPFTTGLEIVQGFWLEVICTFVLLFASVWNVYDHRQAKNLGFLLVFSIIGVVAGILVFISTTVTAKKGYAGAGMNPARCWGSSDGERRPPVGWPLDLWAGPGIACLAFYIYTIIIPHDHFYA